MNHTLIHYYNPSYFFKILAQKKHALATLFLLTFIFSLLAFILLPIKNFSSSTTVIITNLSPQANVKLIATTISDRHLLNHPDIAQLDILFEYNNILKLKLASSSKIAFKPFLDDYLSDFQNKVNALSFYKANITFLEKNLIQTLSLLKKILFSTLISTTLTFIFIIYTYLKSHHKNYIISKNVFLRSHLNKTDRIVLFLLFFFFISFFLFPKIPNLPLRFEDTIFLLLFIFSYKYIKLPKSPLFYIILSFFFINILIYFIYLLTGQYELSIYPIILIKEVQYIYIAFLLYYYQSQRLYRLIDILMFINIIYGIACIATGKISYYGIGTINSISPSLSGGQYFLFSVWIHIRLKYIPKINIRYLYKAFAILSIICTFATISRSSIIALFIYWFIYFLLRKPKQLIIGSTVIMIFMLNAFQLNPKLATNIQVVSSVVSRMQHFGDAGSTRLNKWKTQINTINPIEYFFGRGKGYGNIVSGSWTLSIDSQYTRTIIENGVFGVLILAFIFFYFQNYLHSTPKARSHLISFFLGFLFMCIPLEAMQVSKIGTLFWMICFYFMSLSCKSLPSKLN
tara:strand:- start:1670 stop:3382 length:1713 start_codon:yes stop_codon:yes gene_type:complete